MLYRITAELVIEVIQIIRMIFQIPVPKIAYQKTLYFKKRVDFSKKTSKLNKYRMPTFVMFGPINLFLYLSALLKGISRVINFCRFKINTYVFCLREN